MTSLALSHIVPSAAIAICGYNTKLKSKEFRAIPDLTTADRHLTVSAVAFTATFSFNLNPPSDFGQKISARWNHWALAATKKRLSGKGVIFAACLVLGIFLSIDIVTYTYLHVNSFFRIILCRYLRIL